MDKEKIPTDIEFDCVDAKWAIQQLEDLVRNANVMFAERDLGIRFEIELFGPAGGNPCIKIHGMSPQTAVQIVDWMIENGLGWSDQNGIHDYAFGPGGQMRRCDRCCEPAYEEGKLCWEHATGRM